MINTLFIGRKFTLKGKSYVIDLQTGPNDFLVKEISSGETMPMGADDFARQIFLRNLKLEPTKDEEKNAVRFFDASLAPVKAQEKARKKLAYVEPTLELTRGQLSDKNLNIIIKQVSAKMGDSHPPKPRSVRRWRYGYIASEKDFRYLFDRDGDKGCRKRLLKTAVFEFLHDAMVECYRRDPNASVQDIHDLSHYKIRNYNKKVEKANRQLLKHSDNVSVYEQIKPQSYMTTFRYVNGIDVYERDVLRFGEAKAKRMHPVIMEKVNPTRPLERVEMDHSYLPFYVIDDETFLPLGCVWLTVAIDSATGNAGGFHLAFEDPSYTSIMECLYHSILPKDYVSKKYPRVKRAWLYMGIPETLFVDNGRDFTSRDLELACNALNIILEYQPPYQPWYKAQVERFFGALNTMLLKHLPGTSICDFLKKFDKDFKPDKNAVITLGRLTEIIHIFIIDIYNARNHRGLNHIPAKAWEQGLEEFSVDFGSRDPDDLLILLSRNEKPHKITVQGIELKNLRYNSKELQKLGSRQKGKKVAIKYDPRDISMIFVYDPVEREYLHVPACNQEYTKGLSMRQHDVIRNFRSFESNDSNRLSLTQAKELIYKIVEGDMAKMKIKGRKAVAKFLDKKQERETTEIDFSDDAKKIMSKLKEQSAANEQGHLQDADADELYAQLIANEIAYSAEGDGTETPPIKSASKKKRAPRKSKKSLPKKTAIETAMQEIETESIPLDDNEEWGGYID